MATWCTRDQEKSLIYWCLMLGGGWLQTAPPRCASMGDSPIGSSRGGDASAAFSPRYSGRRSVAVCRASIPSPVSRCILSDFVKSMMQNTLCTLSSYQIQNCRVVLYHDHFLVIGGQV
jgi:hypothetical protein